MRSSCDLVIWVKTREVADHHVRFMRSANDVLLTEDTIGRQFFHSVQITQSCEVLPATEGPPHPQPVALAISRAPPRAPIAGRGRDAQRSRQHMTALYQVTDMVACPVSALTRWICRTTIGRQHHGRGLHHRISAHRAQPPNRSRPVRISLPRTRRRKGIRQRAPRDQLSITSTLRRALANMLCELRLAWSDLLSHSRHPPLSHTLRPQTIDIDDTPGCVPSGCPNVHTRLHLQIKSRPGPKSGVGH